MVLKPSEVAPLNAVVFAEILDEAGVPAGVFNLVQGDGVNVGAPLSAHPDARHGVVHRLDPRRGGGGLSGRPDGEAVAQELGGKSANIILDGTGPAGAITRDHVDVQQPGQSCNAPTRMLVPAARMDEAAAIAAAAAEQIVVGDPTAGGSRIGPVVSAVSTTGPAAHREGHRGGRQGRGQLASRTASDGYYVRPTVIPMSPTT